MPDPTSRPTADRPPLPALLRFAPVPVRNGRWWKSGEAMAAVSFVSFAARGRFGRFGFSWSQGS